MMRPLSFVRSKFREVRWWFAARRTRNSPLREFVYLDETSVVSLLASRLGPVADQITESTSATRGSEFGLSGSRAGAPTTLGISAKVSASEVRGSTVVRKASAQSNFRDLYNYERRRILDLTPEVTGGQRTRIESEARLVRGQLIEMVVELEADPSFGSNLVLSEVATMIGDDAAEFGVRSADLTKLRALHRVIGRLQVGLVPIRARIIDYHDLKSQGGDASLDGDIYLTAVTNVDNYWQDIREVLFSRQRYKVLARLSHPGLQDDWNPNRLLKVLSPHAPDLARAIEDMSAISFNAPGVLGGTERLDDQMVEALNGYVAAWISDQGLSVSALDYQPADEDARADTIELQRRAFGRADEFLKAAGAEYSRDQAADKRDESLAAAGLSNALTVSGVPTGHYDSAHAVGRRQGRFLEAEIVAIYW